MQVVIDWVLSITVAIHWMVAVPGDADDFSVGGIVFVIGNIRKSS